MGMSVRSWSWSRSFGKLLKRASATHDTSGQSCDQSFRSGLTLRPLHQRIQRVARCFRNWGNVSSWGLLLWLACFFWGLPAARHLPRIRESYSIIDSVVNFYDIAVYLLPFRRIIKAGNAKKHGKTLMNSDGQENAPDVPPERALLRPRCGCKLACRLSTITAS